MRLFHSRRDIGQAATASLVTRMRPRDVFLLALAHRSGERGIVEQDVVLVVEFEAAAVHVGRADQRDLAVQRQRLGVQQTALVLVDLDAGGQQVGVVAAAGRADDPRVVPGRKDDRRVDAPVGGRAQRVLHRLVGHVVGRGDDEFAAGREHQGFEHLGHGRVAHGRAGADHLRGAPRWAGAAAACSGGRRDPRPRTSSSRWRTGAGSGGRSGPRSASRRRPRARTSP